MLSSVIPLPNPRNADEIFTIAGNKAFIWDYTKDELVHELPDTPLQPRCFPSSASFALLPLKAPEFTPKVLLCGGSSTDIPDPKALDDCYTLEPADPDAKWVATDNLPNGGQTMSDAILLPNGKVLLLNGAHKGSAGGWMADDPVTELLVYDDSAPAGERFPSMPRTEIPQIYHSFASLLPSGEVIVAGSNPDVFYNPVGGVPPSYPWFYNNGNRSVLIQQREEGSLHPTEYRVEIFSPTYMDAASRPSIAIGPRNNIIKYRTSFNVTLAEDFAINNATIKARLINPGFHNHGIAMDQRLVELEVRKGSQDNVLLVSAPPNATVMVPGMHLLFMAVEEVVSEGIWASLS